MYKLCALIGLLFVIEACLARPGSAPERRGPPAKRPRGPPPRRGPPPPARVQPPPPPRGRRPPPPPPPRRRPPPPPPAYNYYDYYPTSAPSYFLPDDCDCNTGDCPPGTRYEGSCGDDKNYCC
ncbi:actin nucleation-promoting factor WASL-like [Saccostrea cucullata]|uniref:actin nucleation-promoting factor WASL-like n=1 Tax=Saccostrea cuccullata TaxID=36930 RepID=UPI002ED4A0F9